MTCQEIINTAAVTVSPEESVLFAARLLSRYNIGALPVVSASGKLKGIITDRDIALRCVAAGSDPAETPVSHVMSRRLVTVGSQCDLKEASHVMAERQVRRVAVTDEDNSFVGMLSLGDLAKTGGYEMEAAAALKEISSNLRRL
ncbi:MAG: CBS domain-containing protein [Ruminococcaceae bacterium]|nr:CBS domain-containing protein [Oscillospiraceae bacterium]